MASAGGGGSKSSSKQSSRPSTPIFSTPLGPTFNNLFGVPTRMSKRGGGFVVAGAPGSGKGSFDFANQLFSPESFDMLGDQLAPVQGGDQFAPAALQGFDQALGLFDENIFPALQELTSTGFRTSAEPIAQQQLERFQQEVVPGLAEQFSFLGGGGSVLSSDFGAAAAREGGNILSDIGALQVGLDEAAAGRRQAGLGEAALLGTQRAALPLDFGEAFRQEELAGRPGGQLLSFLDQLAGIVERDPIVQANVSTGKSSAFGINAQGSYSGPSQ